MANVLSPALLGAKTAEGRQDYRTAVELYTKAMNFLLFQMMLDYANEQVKSIQEARFRCFRAMRVPSPSGDANE